MKNLQRQLDLIMKKINQAKNNDLITENLERSSDVLNSESKLSDDEQPSVVDFNDPYKEKIIFSPTAKKPHKQPSIAAQIDVVKSESKRNTQQSRQKSLNNKIFPEDQKFVKKDYTNIIKKEELFDSVSNIKDHNVIKNLLNHRKSILDSRNFEMFDKDMDQVYGMVSKVLEKEKNSKIKLEYKLINHQQNDFSENFNTNPQTENFDTVKSSLKDEKNFDTAKSSLKDEKNFDTVKSSLKDENNSQELDTNRLINFSKYSKNPNKFGNNNKYTELIPVETYNINKSRKESPSRHKKKDLYDSNIIKEYTKRDKMKDLHNSNHSKESSRKEKKKDLRNSNHSKEYSQYKADKKVSSHHSNSKDFHNSIHSKESSQYKVDKKVSSHHSNPDVEEYCSEDVIPPSTFTFRKNENCFTNSNDPNKSPATKKYPIKQESKPGNTENESMSYPIKDSIDIKPYMKDRQKITEQNESLNTDPDTSDSIEFSETNTEEKLLKTDSYGKLKKQLSKSKKVLEEQFDKNDMNQTNKDLPRKDDLNKDIKNLESNVITVDTRELLERPN